MFAEDQLICFSILLFEMITINYEITWNSLFLASHSITSTPLRPDTCFRDYANSADPDQMPQHSIWSNSTLFTNRNFYAKYSKEVNIYQKTPTTMNGFIQMFRVAKSTGKKKG